MLQRNFWLTAWIAMLCAAAAGTLAAQDREGRDEPARPLIRLRLPAYYGRVVDDQQREDIYGVLRQYEEKLLALRQEIQQLEQERDSEVRKVLTKEQAEEVDRLTEEARQRRLERAKARAEQKEDATSKSDGATRRGR